MAYRFSILILDTFAPFLANLASVARGYDACVRSTPTLENELSFRLNEGPRAHEILRRREVGLVAATETRVGRGGVGGAGCGCRSRRGAETGRKIVEEYSALSLDDWPLRWGFNVQICVTSQNENLDNFQAKTQAENQSQYFHG